jgi:AGZA family xanthine/uracil permease-like MFS transporter
MNFIENFFQLSRVGSSIKKEAIAGLTTFLAMAYIVVVNPSILSNTGMDFGAIFVATCIAAALGSILMGVLGNYPIAQAPGMGQNAFFTYTIVIGMGYTWQVALGSVFISGVIFIILSILPVREWLINSIPLNLKLGMSAGIGLFLGVIALQNANIVVDNPATLVSLGQINALPAMICLFGFVLIAALSAKKVIGAVIIGILATTFLGWVFGDVNFSGIVSMPPSVAPVFMQLDIAGAFQISMITVILSLLLVDVFDTAGTLVGVASRANMLDEKGHLPRLGKALLSDSGATALGAVVGTSSTTSYIESAAGVEAGGRTGLTAVITGILFLLALFFVPLVQSIPAYATSAALLFVAVIMSRSLAELDWDDLSESTPAVLAAITMPLAFSISDGIGLGFITYALIKILLGKHRECSVAVYVIALIFAAKYLFL